MAAKTKPDVLWVQPVSGKYCEVVSGQGHIRVWKVHPNSPNRFGTPVPYDVAVQALASVPPIVTLVPVIENGKYVSQLLDEDVAKIEAVKARGFQGSYSNYNRVDVEKPNAAGASTSDAALQQALSLLQEQTKANQALQASLADLQQKVAGLEASSVSGTPADASANIDD